jgi:hypothetical protein
MVARGNRHSEYRNHAGWALLWLGHRVSGRGRFTWLEIVRLDAVVSVGDRESRCINCVAS